MYVLWPGTEPPILVCQGDAQSTEAQIFLMQATFTLFLNVKYYIATQLY